MLALVLINLRLIIAGVSNGVNSSKAIMADTRYVYITCNIGRLAVNSADYQVTLQETFYTFYYNIRFSSEQQMNGRILAEIRRIKR